MLLLVWLFEAFRVSELVSQSRSTVGGLLRADVQVSAEGLTLLRRSKTDVLGKGRRFFLFHFPGSDLCLVKCVEELLVEQPVLAVVLLVHRDGSFLS